MNLRWHRLKEWYKLHCTHEAVQFGGWAKYTDSVTPNADMILAMLEDNMEFSALGAWQKYRRYFVPGSLQVMINLPGPSDVADPCNIWGTMGWKAISVKELRWYARTKPFHLRRFYYALQDAQRRMLEESTTLAEKLKCEE